MNLAIKASRQRVNKKQLKHQMGVEADNFKKWLPNKFLGLK